MEEKGKVNLYAMFQIREVVGWLQMFFKLGVLKNYANFIVKHLCYHGQNMLPVVHIKPKIIQALSKPM